MTFTLPVTFLATIHEAAPDHGSDAIEGLTNHQCGGTGRWLMKD